MSKNKILTLLLFLVSFSGILRAVVICDIDTTLPLRCAFSFQHQNRIIVEGGYVKKIICPEQFFLIRMESESGQAILFPHGNFKRPVTLTVVTDSGLVQDIEVFPEDRSSEVVILREPVSIKLEDNENIFLHGLDSTDQIVNMVKNSLRNVVPSGYISNEMEDHPSKIFSVGIEAKVIRVWEGPYEKIFFFELCNISNHGSVKLLAEGLQMDRGKWSFLETQDIKPREHSLAIIATEKKVSLS